LRVALAEEKKGKKKKSQEKKPQKKKQGTLGQGQKGTDRVPGPCHRDNVLVYFMGASNAWKRNEKLNQLRAFPRPK
jgi:hypothetical protein